MPSLEEKIVNRLQELIQEGEQLSKEISQSEDPNFDMWRMKCEKLLERMGGEELVGQYTSVGEFSYVVGMSESESLEYDKRAIGGRTDFLKVVKDDLELFGGEDEKELKKIKHRFEGGINLGILKGKYTQER